MPEHEHLSPITTTETEPLEIDGALIDELGRTAGSLERAHATTHLPGLNQHLKATDEVHAHVDSFQTEQQVGGDVRFLPNDQEVGEDEPDPTLHQALDELRQQRVKQGRRAESGTGIVEYDFKGLLSALGTGEYSLADASSALKEYYECKQHQESVRTRAHRKNATLDLVLDAYAQDLVKADLLAVIRHDMPIEKVRQMYNSPRDDESGLLKHTLRTFIEQDNDQLSIYSSALVLAEIKGYDSLRSLWDHAVSIKNEEAPDKQELAVLKHPELLLTEHEWEPSDTEQSVEEAAKQFGAEYLRDILGLSDDWVKDALWALRGRAGKFDEETEEIVFDDYGFKEELEDITVATKYFTVEEILRLREKTGLLNIGTYDYEQLKLMLDLADGNKDAIEHLRSGNISVSFRDALEDHNGALQASSDVFVNDHGRGLFFEVSSAKDDLAEINTYLGLLEEHDLHPAVVTFSAHGSAGYMRFHDSYVSYAEPSKYSRSTDEMAVIGESNTLKKLFKLMKADSDGRCSLILQSCSQASRQTRLKQSGAEAMANAAYAARGEAVDVYATPVATNVKRDPYDGTLKYQNAYVVRVSVDDNGSIVETTQRTIDLETFRRSYNRLDNEVHIS